MKIIHNEKSSSIISEKSSKDILNNQAIKLI